MKRANDIPATDTLDDEDDERIANTYAPREPKWARDWRQVMRSPKDSKKIKHVQMDELMQLIEQDLLDVDGY